jgi:GAF domain-containing protein
VAKSSDPHRRKRPASWTKRLIELSTATDRIMESILLGNQTAILDEVAHQSHVLLRAEACSIFLVDENSPDMIVKVASHADVWGVRGEVEPKRGRVRLKIQSVPGGGLTGHIAKQGQIVELHGSELTSNPYSVGKQPDHLSSGRCVSLLGIPLKDRKGKLLGLMVVDNKKGSDGEARDGDHFTKEDISIAKILASKTTLVLESQRTSEIFQRLLTNLQGGSSVSEVLDAILQEGLKLLRADRGDLAMVDEDRGDLVLMARFGEWDQPIGAPIPQESIMRNIWMTGESRPIFSDVQEDPTYYEADERTKSEIAVCLE